MVDVAQWLEHWIVVPGVVGSIPIFHPSKNRFCKYKVGFFVLDTTHARSQSDYLGRVGIFILLCVAMAI